MIKIQEEEKKILGDNWSEEKESKYWKLTDLWHSSCERLATNNPSVPAYFLRVLLPDATDPPLPSLPSPPYINS